MRSPPVRCPVPLAVLGGVGGFGALLKFLDIELPALPQISNPSLGAVVSFLDQNMAKDVDVLGVGGETVIKADAFQRGGKTTRSKKAKK